MTIGATAFRLGFEISPIILVGGVAASMPGGMLPIAAITEAANFASGLLNGNITIFNLDDYFAHFVVVPGAQLANNQIGSYPFANQAVAANSIIAQPLTVSLKMICPVKSAGGYVSKLITFSALQQALQQHSFSGGTFTVATPSFIYTNCILTGLKDVSGGQSNQVQYEWQFDFVQPLLAIADANLVLNSLMSKLDGGLPTSGQWTGVGAVINSAGNGLTNAVSGVSGAIGSLTSSSSTTSNTGSSISS